MKRIVAGLIAFVMAGGALTAATGTAPAGAVTVRWVSGYYPSYEQFTMPPSQIDFTGVTHLIHWPVIPNTDGTLDTARYDFTAAHSNDVVTRAHTAGVKVLLGLGGGESAATDGFHAATQPSTRTAFVTNIVSLMKARHYDGVDINWEAFGDDDETNFVAFFHQLRTALNAVTPRPLLTFPPTTGSDLVAHFTGRIQADLDQINLQTYVMSGPYPGWVSWFNSPLHNGGLEFPCCAGQRVPSADDELARFTGQGITRAKLGLGLQFDGVVWQGGLGTDTGGVTRPRQSWLAMPYLPNEQGNEFTAPTATFQTYAYIVETYRAEDGYVSFYDDVAEQPYLSLDSLVPSGDTFISVENERSIAAKGAYVRSQGLGGSMVFELAGDYLPDRPAGQRHPLLQAVKTSLK